MPDEDRLYALQSASPDVIANLLKLDPKQRELFRLLHSKFALEAELRSVEAAIHIVTSELTDDPA